MREVLGRTGVGAGTFITVAAGLSLVKVTVASYAQGISQDLTQMMPVGCAPHMCRLAYPLYARWRIFWLLLNAVERNVAEWPYMLRSRLPTLPQVEWDGAMPVFPVPRGGVVG